jgi:hypothetical protein
MADRGPILVEGGAGTMDRSWALGVPGVSFIAHSLDADRPAAFDKSAASIPASPASFRP